MPYTTFKARKTNEYGIGTQSYVASNSSDFGSGTAVSMGATGAVVASAGTSIVGVSVTDNTFASDNFTVAKDKVTFVPKEAGQQYEIAVSGGTQLLFAGALVVSNTINFTVNGTAMTQVTYTSSNDATLDAIATQLTTQFPTLIANAYRSGTRIVAITPVEGVTITLASIVVAAGGSQTTGSQVNNMDLDNVGSYYDIKADQTVDGPTVSTSTGQLRLDEFKSQTRGIFTIVNL